MCLYLSAICVSTFFFLLQKRVLVCFILFLTHVRKKGRGNYDTLCLKHVRYVPTVCLVGTPSMALFFGLCRPVTNLSSLCPRTHRNGLPDQPVHTARYTRTYIIAIDFFFVPSWRCCGAWAPPLPPMLQSRKTASYDDCTMCITYSG